jgi:nicotinate-nucleotide adenylyltransferase
MCSSILFVSQKGYDISATEIRQRVAEGLDVAGMLPEKVIDYIRRNRIYQA